MSLEKWGFEIAAVQVEAAVTWVEPTEMSANTL